LWRADVITNLSVSVIEQTTSTSDLARSAIDDGAVSGTVFQAHIQTRGRGRHGRVWQSPKGNLYLSVIVQPSRPQMDWPGLSLVAGLALADTFAPLIKNGHLCLKWPNDVLVDDKKIAGVLLEVYKGGVIIGIGVNLVTAPDVGAESWPATALTDHISQPVFMDDFRDQLLTHLQHHLANWDQAGLEPFIKPWTDYAAFLNENIILAHETGKPTHGRFRGIHPDGTMRLETDTDGMLSISAGDVIRARPVKQMDDPINKS
jgi:BirA family biotin operon repressor/biotin-[acetyl-CoA-carboxylase] ligase